MSDQVVDISERSRFVLERDGAAIGKAVYRREPGVITFTHTEVDQSIQERGLGSMLAKAALDDSTSRSSGPLSQCSPKGVQPMPTMATRSLMP